MIRKPYLSVIVPVFKHIFMSLGAKDETERRRTSGSSHCSCWSRWISDLEPVSSGKEERSGSGCPVPPWAQWVLTAGSASRVPILEQVVKPGVGDQCLQIILPVLHGSSLCLPHFHFADFFLEEKKAQAEKWAHCSVFVLSFRQWERGERGGREVQRDM